MVKIVRKFASAFVVHQDRDNRRGGIRLLAGVVESERTNLDNIGRAWRLR